MPRSLRYWPSVKRDANVPVRTWPPTLFFIACDAPVPPLTHSTSRSGSSPARMPIASASAAAARFVADSMLLIVFAASPSPGRSPTWTSDVAELGEQRPGALDERGRAAEHDRQRARLGAGDAAADRRVEQRGAALGGGLGERLRRRRARARHLEPERAVAQAGEQALGAARGPLDDRPGRAAS